MSEGRQLPLDEILGTRANMRVLRVFRDQAHAPRLLWPSEIVEKTGLSRAGVWKALNRLESQLIIEPVNLAHGRAIPYRWVRRHRLAEPLFRLFVAEAEVLWRLRISGEPDITAAFIDPEIAVGRPCLW
jgi:hypothetical protein